jgi:phosphate transport system permease protein
MGSVAEVPFGLVMGLVILCLGLLAWRGGRARAFAWIDVPGQRLHSLPKYHAWFMALWVVLPAFFVLLIHSWIADSLIRQWVMPLLPAQASALSKEQLDVFLSDAHKIAFGGTPSQSTSAHRALADAMQRAGQGLNWAFGLGALALALRGCNCDRHFAPATRLRR